MQKNFYCWKNSKIPKVPRSAHLLLPAATCPPPLPLQIQNVGNQIKFAIKLVTCLHVRVNKSKTWKTVEKQNHMCVEIRSWLGNIYSHVFSQWSSEAKRQRFPHRMERVMTRLEKWLDSTRLRRVHVESSQQILTNSKLDLTFLKPF